MSAQTERVIPGTTSSLAAEMRRGVMTMAPMLAGVVLFGMAFAVSSRAAGFSPLETMLISLTVFAGGAARPQSALCALRPLPLDLAAVLHPAAEADVGGHDDR